MLKFEDSSEKIKYQKNYFELLKKLDFIKSGKRLVIKNPPNTGRIEMLLSLFPNAQFIYLHRDEQAVIPSTVNMHQQMINRFGLTTKSNLNIEEMVKKHHTQIIKQYNTNKKLIPENNLIEIDYRNFIDYPEITLSNIYNKLNLNGFTETLPVFRKYINQQKKHTENFTPAKVNELVPQFT